MDEKLVESIKKNRGVLRQLTALNNEVKELRDKIKKLEQKDSYYPNAEELKRIPLYEGCDD